MITISQTRIRIPYPYNNYACEEPRKIRKLKTCLNESAEQPVFIWFITLTQILVFVTELVRNWWLTGSPLQIKPSFNFLLGPSVFVLINMGARYSPCMRTIADITNNSSLTFPCPNFTGLIEQNSCSLNELCGAGSSIPSNQWHRFVISIFLHSGFIHISLNLFGQLSLGATIEKKIGSFRLAIIYLASGIFGNLVSGIFSPNELAVVGCSGSLFGILGLTFLDLLYNWHRNSSCEVTILLISVLLDLGIGLLPAVDNFAHIGGLIMGFLLGLVLLDHPIKFQHRRKLNSKVFIENHGVLERFFNNHPRKWWIWCLLRFIVLILIIITYAWSIDNVYSGKIRCSWCQYISCLPINGWCGVNQLKTLITTNSTSSLHINSAI